MSIAVLKDTTTRSRTARACIAHARNARGSNASDGLHAGKPDCYRRAIITLSSLCRINTSHSGSSIEGALPISCFRPLVNHLKSYWQIPNTSGPSLGFLLRCTLGTRNSSPISTSMYWSPMAGSTVSRNGSCRSSDVSCLAKSS